MVCCVTGHRPASFPFERDENNGLFKAYKKQLYDEIKKLAEVGYKDFITGMAYGVDIDFAESVLYLREIYRDITLEAALPYPMHALKRINSCSTNRERILLQCDSIKEISTYYHNGCMQKRNCYMVDKSDVVLAVWNGKNKGGTWNTIKYARLKNKEIRYIML